MSVQIQLDPTGKNIGFKIQSMIPINMKVKVVNSNGIIEETLAPFNNDLRWAKGIKIYEKNKMLLGWNTEQTCFFSL